MNLFSVNAVSFSLLSLFLYFFFLFPMCIRLRERTTIRVARGKKKRTFYFMRMHNYHLVDFSFSNLRCHFKPPSGINGKTMLISPHFGFILKKVGLFQLEQIDFADSKLEKMIFNGNLKYFLTTVKQVTSF